jgi:hypothetical protein
LWQYLPSYVRKIPAKLKLCYDILRAHRTLNRFLRLIFIRLCPTWLKSGEEPKRFLHRPPDQLPGLDFNRPKPRRSRELAYGYAELDESGAPRRELFALLPFGCPD